METVKILRSRRGEFLLHSAVVLLAAAMLLSAAVSAYHVYHVVGAVRDKVNEAVLAVAADNVAEFYGGAREADGFARHPEDGTFNFNIDTGDVQDKLAQAVDATNVTDNSITVGDQYAIKDLDTQYVNNSGGNLHFKSTMIVTVPLTVLGQQFPITKKIEVTSSYAPKF